MEGENKNFRKVVALSTRTAYKVVSGEWNRFCLPEGTDYRGKLIICSDESEGAELQDSLCIVGIVDLVKVEAPQGAVAIYTVENPVRLIEAPFRALPKVNTFFIPEDCLQPYPNPENIRRWMKKIE